MAVVQSNQGIHVWLTRRWPASRGIADHGIAHDQQLAHAGDNDDLGLFAGQAFGEGGDHRVAAFGAERGHVEDLAHRLAAAFDVALAGMPATAVIERRHADQAGDGVTRQLAEFGQQRDQGLSQHRADTGHAAQPHLQATPVVVCANELGQLPLDRRQLGLKAAPPQFGLPPQGLVLQVFQLVVAVDDPFAQPVTERQMLDQRIERAPARRLRCFEQHRGEMRHGSRIHAIILRQSPLGLGKSPHPQRIEQSELEARRLQRVDHHALITTGGFQADAADLVLRQPGGQRGQAGIVARDMRHRSRH